MRGIQLGRRLRDRLRRSDDRRFWSRATGIRRGREKGYEVPVDQQAIADLEAALAAKTAELDEMKAAISPLVRREKDYEAALGEMQEA